MTTTITFRPGDGVCRKDNRDFYDLNRKYAVVDRVDGTHVYLVGSPNRPRPASKLVLLYRNEPRQPAEPHSAVAFLKGGYSVQPSVNGGFTVHKAAPEGYRTEHAAFSTARDMLDWLTAGHA